jgi:mono/diheme cytochrome c family protein
MRLLARTTGAALGILMVACATGGESAPVTPATTEVPATAAAPAADAAPMGQQAYARHCLTCHQADGYGVPNMQPAIKGGTWVQGEVQALALFVLTGGFNSAERKDSELHNVMPAFRQLPDEELAEILTYIRQKFGNGASPVSAAEVAAARATL